MGTSITNKVHKCNHLFEAVISNDVGTLNALLTHKMCDAQAPTETGEPIIFVALRCGNPDVISCLLQHGANLAGYNESHVTATICKAIQVVQGQELVGLLKSTDRNIDSYRTPCGKPFLHYAARHASHVIPLLLQAGCDVNATDPVHGETVLHTACLYGNMDTIVYLVQSGAEINALNKYGQTAMDRFMKLCVQPDRNSAARHRSKLAHILVKMGFEVSQEVKDKQGGSRSKLLFVFEKAKQCSEIPSLQHLCRRHIRQRLPQRSISRAVRCLEISENLKDFLLFRPRALDEHVLCDHARLKGRCDLYQPWTVS